MPPTGTFIANVEITINGDTIRRANHVRIGQRFESHHDFEISVSPEMLPDRTIKLRDLADKMVGKTAAITLRQGREGASEQTQRFTGIVTSVRLVKGQSQSSTYLISGLSPTILLSSGPTCRSFLDKTLAQIIDEVLTPFTFDSVTSADSSTPIPYLAQYEEDNFHFLQRLAEETGEWTFYDGTTFIFGKGQRQPSPTVALVHGRNLFDMEYGLRITPLNFKAVWFNYENQDPQIFGADSTQESVEGLSSFSQLTHDRSAELFTDDLRQAHFTDHATLNSLKKAVKLKKSEQANKLAVFTGRTPEMELKIGGLVTITEPVLVNGAQTDVVNYGTFVVTRLNHFVDARGVYQANFEAVPQETDFAPVDYRIVTPFAKPQLAQVKAVDDNLKLGRVKVKFIWQEPADTTQFIRVSTMMTGSSKSYFIPEVGDLVMVDFEQGNPDLPYVSGSLYANHPGARDPGDELFKSDNHIKGIITRGGNHIIIDDTDGKEKIHIFNKENKNEIEMSLDGDSHINIKSKGSVNISAGSINLNASKININASEDLVLHGEDNIKGTSKDKIDIHGKSFKLKSDTDVNIEGLNVNIKATANAKVEAGGQLELKGGPMATMKAGIIQIN
ncbi:MAG: contractile injection system protein, VgrG/Pvc8 family [Spirosomataceae bacterium]